MGIEVDIYVNPRVQEHHPDMSPATVQEAWNTTLRCIPRDTDPVKWVGVGIADGKLIEYIAIENNDETWHIFQDMKASKKTLREAGLEK